MRKIDLFVLIASVIVIFSTRVINAQNNNDTVTLIHAAIIGDTKTVKLLIEQGTYIDAEDKRHKTALIWAATNGHLDIVELLLSKGADIKSQQGGNALVGAAERKRADIVKLLMDKGVNINSRDDDGGRTSLMYAAAHGQMNLVKLLIDKGADTNIKDKMNWTALMFASNAGHTDIVKLLLSKGADVNLKTDTGWTALMFASHTGYIDIVKRLLSKGADVNLKTNIGSTASIIAAEAGYSDIVDLLKKAGASDSALAQGILNITRNHYIGTIGDRYKIYMDLRIENNKLSGYYFYESVGKPIRLAGDIDSNGHFTITEFSEQKETETDPEKRIIGRGNSLDEAWFSYLLKRNGLLSTTGIFKGTLDQSFHSINGEWSTMDGNKRLPFKLNIFARYKGSKSFEYPQFLNNPPIQKKLDVLIQKIKQGDYENNELDYKIEYFSNNLVSILFILKFTEAGDRRGDGYLSFNATPAGEIKLSDLFKPNSNYNIILTDLCINDIKKQETQEPVSFYEPALIDQLNEFVITPTGLNFLTQNVLLVVVQLVPILLQYLSKI